MELGRMMPGVETNILRNIPLYVSFGSTVWIGYVIIFRWYQNREYQYNEVYSRKWGTIVALLTSIDIAIVIEIVAAQSRNTNK